MGRVSERRWVFLEALEVDRESLPKVKSSGGGGGGMVSSEAAGAGVLPSSCICASWTEKRHGRGGREGAAAVVMAEAASMAVASTVTADSSDDVRATMEERRRMCWVLCILERVRSLLEGGCWVKVAALQMVSENRLLLRECAVWALTLRLCRYLPAEE
jgi:hypothetical protein